MRWKVGARCALICVASLVCGVGPAWAQGAPGAAAQKDEGPQKKTGISGILGTMDWLASDVDVLNHIEQSLKDEYREKMADVRDTLQIDRLMRERREKFNEIKETLVRFDGQRTGYETSLIAQDYLPNDGESVLRVDDKAAQRYYFFKHGRLWKVVVAYHSSVTKAMSFESFVKQVQSKYGPAAHREVGTVEGKKALVSAVWEDDITQLTTENRTGFFGTYVMKFISKSEGLAYEAERADRKDTATATAGDAKADSLMADISGGPTGSDVGEDVVDRLTGVEHEVDLTAGRTFAKPLVRASDIAAARPAAPRAEPGAKAAPPARSGGKKPSGTARGDAAKAVDDEPDAPADSPNSDVIIY